MKEGKGMKGVERTPEVRRLVSGKGGQGTVEWVCEKYEPARGIPVEILRLGDNGDGQKEGRSPLSFAFREGRKTKGTLDNHLPLLLPPQATTGLTLSF